MINTKINIEYALYEYLHNSDFTADNYLNFLDISKLEQKNKQIIKMLTDYETDQIRCNLISACPYIYNDIVDVIIKFVVYTIF